MIQDRSTMLGLFCERVIEGCWLAAVVVTPLFFNVYSNRIFEPDKTALLRSIALIMGLAWTVKGLEHWAARRNEEANRHAAVPRYGERSLRRRLTSNPIALAVLLLLLVNAFATLISVAPRWSLWGSYARLQGLYTTAVYVLVFFSVLTLLRTREQMDRLITAALVASLPVSLYGLIQYFGTDPLPWASDVTARVASSMGNPVFVAAFLVLTVPLTLYRLFASGNAAAVDEGSSTRRVLVAGGLISLAFQMAAWQAGPIAGTASAVITVGTWVAVASLLKRPMIPFLRISSYTVLLAAQLMCVLFSQSRGPWIGLSVGLFLFALVWTLVLRRWKQAVLVVGGGLAIGLLLVATNWPGSPLGVVRDVPYAGRLGQLTGTGGGSGRVRVLIWEGVVDLIRDDPIRALVGYGPETLQLVFPPHYPPELGRVEGNNSLPDRAHNETLDALVTTGFAGFVLYLFFFTCLVYYGLKWTGCLRTAIHRKVFLASWFVGGGAGMLLTRLIDGSWRFAGVSLPIGMIAGLLAYVGVYAVRSYLVWRDDDSGQLQDSNTGLRLAVTALLAAIVVHFVETQFGFGIAATQTYLWSYAALFAALGIFIGKHRSPVSGVVPSESSTEPSRPQRSLLAGSMVAGLVLVTLVYDLVVVATTLNEARSVLWLLSFTWAFGGFVVITETQTAQPSLQTLRHWLRPLGMYGVLSLAPGLVYAIIHGGLLRVGANPANLLPVYYGAVLICVLVLGFGLLRRDLTPLEASPDRFKILYLVLAAATLYGAYETNVNVIRADTYFKQALASHEQKRYERAVALYRHALDIEPDQDTYHLYLGKALAEMAPTADDPQRRFREAERALLNAQAVSPLNRDHAANLARLHRSWGLRQKNAARRTDRLQKAVNFFDQATRRSPNSVGLWNELGTTYLLMEDTTEAIRTYRHSLAIDDAFFRTHLLLGNVYYNLGRWQDAADAYERTLELEPDLDQVRLALAMARAQIEREKQ